MFLLVVLVQVRSRNAIDISSPQPIRLSEAPARAKRFTFHDLRAKSASDKDGFGERRGALGPCELADTQVRLSTQDTASDTASVKILDAARNIRQTQACGHR
jgi:hypothetical protein